MSNCPFCNLDTATNSTGLDATEPESGNGKRPGFLHCAWRGIQWLFPTTLLVLMPKCPLCVAAYVTLFTGVGITVATARWIQTSMLVICVTTLAYLVVRHVYRWLHRACSTSSADITGARC